MSTTFLATGRCHGQSNSWHPTFCKLPPAPSYEEGKRMNICLILDNPETPHHPVIAKVLKTLSTIYTVRLLDVNTLSGAQAIAQEEMHRRADFYLLKSHPPQALEVAKYLEQCVARPVSGCAAIAAR